MFVTISAEPEIIYEVVYDIKYFFSPSNGQIHKQKSNWSLC